MKVQCWSDEEVVEHSGMMRDLLGCDASEVLVAGNQAIIRGGGVYRTPLPASRVVTKVDDEVDEARVDARAGEAGASKISDRARAQLAEADSVRRRSDEIAEAWNSGSWRCEEAHVAQWTEVDSEAISGTRPGFESQTFEGVQ